MAETLSFGNWIRQRRRTLDLTQDELASRVGCSLSAIRKIEADERRPSRQIAELLADTLQISPADRATFLRVARLELGYDRLPAIDTLVLARQSATLSDLLPAQASMPGHNGGGRPLPRNLPTPPTPLVGREVEVARIGEILLGPECRLLTLTGPGGIGKTRLAIAAAERLTSSFGDGVCFVPLAVVTSPEAIWTAMAAALGFRLHTAENPKEQLASYLQSRHLLLVLDNLEHLLDGVGIIADVVQGATQVRVLATSREQLGLSGEWVLDIHGLGVPAALPTVAGLPPDWERSSSVVLFLQAARRSSPGFTLRAEDYAAIAQICRLVEGIPLGIELAAAWVRMLTCAEIALEIERSYDFLATKARDVPQRQRSLRAAFEHSWHLLPPTECSILQALSVFAGGFTRRAADEVAGATLPDLAALIARSLVVRMDDGRYGLHETVRQYAAEKLDEAGAAADVWHRHWQYFLRQAQEADAARNSPQHMALVDQLELESDNLHAALAWLLEHDVAEAWLLAAVLEAHWYRRTIRESQAWLERLASAAARSLQPIPMAVRARVELIRATFLPSLGEMMAAMHDVLALARAGNEPRVTALALSILSNEGLVGGGFDQGESYFAEARRLAEATGDKATLTTVLAERGETARYQADYPLAIEYYTAGAALAREIGRTDLHVNIVFSLAKMAMRQGDLQRALDLMEPAVSVYESIHDRVGLASAQLLIARALTAQGDYARARSLIDTAEAVFHDTGFHGNDNFLAMLRGNIEYALGNVRAALGLYELAIDLCADVFEPIVMTMSQRCVACCALRQGDLAAARAAAERSRHYCDITHERWVRALLEFTYGQIAWLAGEPVLADLHYGTGLDQVLLLGDQCAVAEALDHWALLHAVGRPLYAVRLFGAAAALRQRIGAPLPPIDRAGVHAGIAAARALLEPVQFAAAWEYGQEQAAGGLQPVVAMALDEN